jgi:hypothetical protein
MNTLRIVLGCGCAVAMTLTTLAAEGTATKPKIRINLDEPAAPAASAVKTTAGAAARPAPATAASTNPTRPVAATAATRPAGRTIATPAKPKIDGLEIARGEHGFLGVKLEDSHFKVSFYNAKKEPVVGDVDRIALRWAVPYQPNPERAVLTSAGDGKSFSADKVIRPPYTFKLYLTLLKDPVPGEELVAETYAVDFAQ